MKTYTLDIKAYTPDTIPMARLALYMQSFAAVLGHQSAVHFQGLKPGSTQLLAVVEKEDAPKVRERFQQLQKGEGAPDALKAHGELDKLLEQDDATGAIVEGTAVIIEFPGASKPTPEVFGPFNQEGSLDGILVSIGGADKTVHIQLQNGELKYTGIETGREIARKLGKHMYEPVRLHGEARWFRDAEGTWILKRFKIASFEALENEDLRQATSKLRSVAGSQWAEMDDPLEAAKAIRDGLH